MRIELHHISKSFGRVHANRDICLTVEAGTIHGILGENGAGKSTLSKVLSGFIVRDAGEIRLDGVSVDLRSPADAIRARIGMLHQDPLDFPALSVLDNFMAGRTIAAKPGDRRETLQELRLLMACFEFDLHPDDTVANLTVGERQQLEILRLLSLGVRALILDEPTTGISASQKTTLFAAVKQLASQGKSILLVSHKLEDVEALCDRVTVMRQGQIVGEAEVKGRETVELASSLVAMMFGSDLTPPARPGVVRATADLPALFLEDIAIDSDRYRLQIGKFAAEPGEVVGLAGLEGSGQQLLLLLCAGLLKPTAGSLRLGDTEMTRRTYRQFLQAGIGYLPADRLQDGLVRGLTIHEHFMLRRRFPGSFVPWRETLGMAQAAIATFQIRGQPSTKVERLSGGNQQRTQLSLLPENLRLLLMEQPTRGLDIESSLWVWEQLATRCAGGTTILFSSADLDEILQYSDRVLVFSGGRVSAPMDAKSLTVEQLGQAIGGKFA